MVDKVIQPKIIWNNRATIYFKKVYELIKEESVTNADKVREGIMKIIDGLSGHAEKYPPDKFKKNNLVTTVLLKNTPTGLPTNIPLKKSEF